MSTSTRVEIAVIGGGAKAAALAAKAFALRRARIADIHVTVFEQSEIGAHWSGKRGYTDGEIERIQAQWRKARSSSMLTTLTTAVGP